MYTIEELKNKINKIHGNKYEYDWTTYTKISDKMKIICPIHGEFWMSLHCHLNKKQGCPKCGKEISIKNRSSYVIQNKRMVYTEFLKTCNILFCRKFQYPFIEKEYKNLSSKITIVCPEHGMFHQTASSHINSKTGCPKCSIKNTSNLQRSTTEKFITQAKKIHGGKYDYSKVEYVDCNTKVCIICPKHGEFWQLPNNHLSGYGCIKCGHTKVNNDNRLNTKSFIEKARKVHGDKYDYSKVEYIDSKTKICIICPKHGEFWQRADKHLMGETCPKCSNQISNAENDIYEYCKKYLGKDNVIQRERKIIKPLELDIYMPTLNAAIEYNGLRWHSEKFGKDKNYHLNKLNACKGKNIKLLQIFEDEYLNKKDIVYNKIKHILKLNNDLPRIMGRKCEVKEIGTNDAKIFLDTYHIQGYARSTVYLGAFYEDRLVAVMTFKKEVKDCNKWELSRFASDYNYICQGIGGKLFKYFIKTYNPQEIKSFADRRWTIDEKNNIYLQLAFKFDGYTNVDYHYFNEKDGIIRQHKFRFRKEKLHNKYGLPLTMTESEMTDKLGYTKIYDCGLIRYVWKKKRVILIITL